MRAWAEAHLGHIPRRSNTSQKLAKYPQVTVRADVLIEAAELHSRAGTKQRRRAYLSGSRATLQRVAPIREMWRPADCGFAANGTADRERLVSSRAHSRSVTYNPGKEHHCRPDGALALLRGDDSRAALDRGVQDWRELQSARYLVQLLSAPPGGPGWTPGPEPVISRWLTNDRAMVSV
ncbi:MAG: hypothetical protein KatS3mg065_0892 [Chloroflexota bacterium]|nr:MAG: hypothetical protein KatS3mg065_0892 [Chloroflexota bacterium]